MAHEEPPSSRPQDAAASRPEHGQSPSVSSAPSLDSSAPGEAVDQRSVLDDTAIRRALVRIAHEIVERHDQIDDLYLVAIPNGGVPLGRILIDNLEQVGGCAVPLGVLDTTLYRDDLTRTGSRPKLRVTEMPSSVDDRVVVLVEDVVNTGRTIRAAMDALMDFGRPRAVQVVALVDRGHRELPIKIDYVGKNIPTAPGEKVRLLESGGDDDAAGTLEVVVQRPRSGAGDGEEQSANRGAHA